MHNIKHMCALYKVNSVPFYQSLNILLLVARSFVLLQVRQNRDPDAANKCLAAIEECARTKEGNLLALAVEAARAR